MFCMMSSAQTDAIVRREESLDLSPMQLPWYKKLAYGVIYAGFMVLVLLLAGELLLRVLPLGAYRSAPFRQYDPRLGLSLMPNQHTIHRRGCLPGEVGTNRCGQR